MTAPAFFFTSTPVGLEPRGCGVRRPRDRVLQDLSAVSGRRGSGQEPAGGAAGYPKAAPIAIMIVLDLTMAELAALEAVVADSLSASKGDLESLKRLEKTVRRIRAEHGGRLERGSHYDGGAGRSLCGADGVKAGRWLIGVTCPGCRDLIRAVGRAYSEARRLRTVDW